MHYQRKFFARIRPFLRMISREVGLSGPPFRKINELKYMGLVKELRSELKITRNWEKSEKNREVVIVSLICSNDVENWHQISVNGFPVAIKKLMPVNVSEYSINHSGLVRTVVDITQPTCSKRVPWAPDYCLMLAFSEIYWNALLFANDNPHFRAGRDAESDFGNLCILIIGHSLRHQTTSLTHSIHNYIKCLSEHHASLTQSFTARPWTPFTVIVLTWLDEPEPHIHSISCSTVVLRCETTL